MAEVQRAASQRTLRQMEVFVWVAKGNRPPRNFWKRQNPLAGTARKNLLKTSAIGCRD